MPPTFSAIPFIVYPIKDMQRAKAFYSGVIALCTQLEGCTPGAKGAAVALEIADFDGMVAHLKAQGVRFVREPVDSSVCMFARLEDPEGNRFVLHRKH